MSTKIGISTTPIPYSFIPSESEQDNPNKLFLGGVATETTEKQLEEFFSQFGRVKDVRIVTDRITAACKGYGFVTFEDDENVEHLVDKKTIRMNGAKLRIRKAIRRNASQFEHVSPSKKWLMVPNNMLQQTPGLLTPPNTPPSMEHLTLYDKATKTQIPAHFLLKGRESMDGIPVLITSNSRSRTNSSPPTYLQSQGQPPSVMIPDDETLFFPQQAPPPPPPPPSMFQQNGRGRTYSTPITMQDYESLHHHGHPQTLLLPANQVPPKIYAPMTPPPPPQFTAQPPPSQANQYLIPYYHSQNPTENLVYCMQPPPQSFQPAQPTNTMIQK